MKKSLVLALAMAMGVTASAYAANPFSDVPAGHWAYDSIAKLADAGVIEGYGDTTFGGDRLMTRYEMAQIVARAMANGANVDKLAAEFADELDSLGVRVAKLEKKADNVKITGEVRYRYFGYDGTTSKGKNTKEDQKLRSRIWFKGSINDNWTYTGMIENNETLNDNSSTGTTDFQRAWVDGRLGGVKVTAGRWHQKDAFEGMIYADRMEGLQVAYGKEVKITLGLGDGTDVSSSPNSDNMYYGELTAKIGVVDARVGYYRFENQKFVDDDNEIWAVGVGLPVIPDLKLTAAYFKSDFDKDATRSYDDDGYYATLKYKGAKASKVNSWGIWASRYDIGIGTTVSGTIAIDADTITSSSVKTGWKGYGVGAEYTFAKNMVGAIKYFDLEGKEVDKDARTFYGELILTF